MMNTRIIRIIDCKQIDEGGNCVKSNPRYTLIISNYFG